MCRCRGRDQHEIIGQFVGYEAAYAVSVGRSYYWIEYYENSKLKSKVLENRWDLRRTEVRNAYGYPTRISEARKWEQKL